MAEQLKLNPMTGEFDLVGQADSDTLATPITGFVSGAGTVTATDTILQAINKLDGNIIASGSGTVTKVSVVTANGVSGSVATDTTTPAITLTLGAITPSTVNGLDLDALSVGFQISGGTTSKTLTVPLDASVSGTNTGDQTLGSLGAEAVANKSTSVSTDGSSDTKYPSVKAVKDYADGLVVGLLDYRGAYNASGNTFPATGGSGTAGAILKGDAWVISVAGTLGGTAIQAGDMIIANTDTPGQTAGNWNTLNTNIGYTPEDSANKVTSISGASTDTQYPSAKLVYDQLAGKQPTGSYLTASDITGKEDSSNKVTSISGSSTDAQYPSAKLVYDQLAGKASTTTVAGKENFHGVAAVGTLAFNNSTHVLSVASITYWYKGTQYTTASPVSCDLDLTADRDNSSNTLATNKLYYFYFKDATGKLYWSDTAWNFKENVFVATVYWNGSAGACQRETHNHTRDLDWHIWSHDTIGCRYESGLTLTNPTTVNDALLQIETGTIHDEDLDIATGQMTTSRGWYQASAGVYTFADYSLPYLGSSGTPQYLRTSDYSLQNVGATNFACYWVYATLDVDRPCYIVPTQATSAHNTVALARAEVAPILAGTGINPEWKLIYRFIYKGDGNFQESTDYRTTATIGGSATASTTAGAVSFAPYGNISATTVQTAIQELDDEKQPLDATLTALAGLDATAGFLKQTGADTFTKDTNTYLTSLTGAVLTDQTSGQTIGATGARLTKLWVTDITCTNAITGSVTGNAGTVTNGIYTTSQVTTLAAAASGDKGKYLKANDSTGALEWATITGGFTDPMTTRGDIIVRKVGGTDRLALGTNGQVLTSDGTDIVWGSASTGLFDIDVNGDLEPVTATLADDYYDLDVNDDLQPKAA